MSENDKIVLPGLQEAVQQTDKKNRVLITAFNEFVVLHVEQPQEYLPFDGVSAVDTALRMLAAAVEVDKRVGQLVINGAMFLIDHVYDVRGELKPVDGAVKHELIERHRMLLTQRVATMLGSIRMDKRKSNGQLAQTLVDVMLKEVF